MAHYNEAGTRLPFRTGIGDYPEHRFTVKAGPCTNCGEEGEVVEIEVVGNAEITYDAAQPISGVWKLCLVGCLPALRGRDWRTLADRRTG